jgi:lauroyl/myristoyl acyltransferase
MRSSAPQTAGWLRAHIPVALLPLVVRVRTTVSWWRSSVREDARAQMGFLLEHTAPDADLGAVAKAYVRAQVRRGELRWHPELLTGLRVEGMEHLFAARDRGRGVILSFTHHGHYDGGFPSIARLGVRAHMVCYPYMLEPDAPAWLRQHVKVALCNGGTAVSAAVRTPGMLELLAQGAVLAIASDVPGSTPVCFAGREVLGSSGAARLATAAGSTVVLMTSEEDEHGPVIRLHEPLDPADFPDPTKLLDRILAGHEAVHLRWPEATDLPLSRWGVVDDEVASVGLPEVS